MIGLDTKAHAVKMTEFERMLGTESAAETARLALFFGPTVAGEQRFVEALGLKLDRALLGGHEIECTRPFVADEPLSVEVKLADCYEKNDMQFGIVETSFRSPGGELIQVQRTTFIERM